LRKGRAQQLHALGVELGGHQGDAGIFRPGCARLTANPRCTGSTKVAETIGTWPLGSTASGATGPSDTMTSTDRATSSAANCGPRIASGGTKFEDDVAALLIAEIVKPRPERIEHGCPLTVSLSQNADARDLRRRLLGGSMLGRQQQPGKPSDDDAAKSHLITGPERTDCGARPKKLRCGITLVAERSDRRKQPSTLAADDIVPLADPPAGSLKGPPWVGPANSIGHHGTAAIGAHCRYSGDHGMGKVAPFRSFPRS